MRYETLLNEALEKVPVFKQEYVKALNNGVIDTNDGMHIVFGIVYVPLVINAIKNNNNTEVLKFLEEMASSYDNKIQEVCDQSILEGIYGEISEDKLVPYLGKHTKEGYYAVAQFMG